MIIKRLYARHCYARTLRRITGMTRCAAVLRMS